MINRLLIVLTMLPLVACSQGNDLGFWEGTPEKLKGCKLWTIQTNNCEFCTSYVTYTDCYGNSKEYRFLTTDGRSYQLCSMDRPVAMNNNPPLVGIASITQTGWCTDPIGVVWEFWLESGGILTDAFPSFMSEVYIYSADVGGLNRNTIYSTTTPQDIAGSGNSVSINDTYTGQNYYVIRVRVRKSNVVGPGAQVWVRPGSGQSIYVNNTSLEYKELIIEKREFYLQMTQ